MTDPEFVLSVLGILGGTAFALSPVMIVRTVLRHREQMAKIKNDVNGAPRLLEEMTALHTEMAILRETTTRFDMSFDAALGRVEDRLTSVEREAALDNGPDIHVEVGTGAPMRPVAYPSQADQWEEEAKAQVVGRRG